MLNKNVTIIACAILVSNVPSFCSDWAGTITRQSSTSYREKLDNIQNGLVLQQHNNNNGRVFPQNQHNMQQNNVQQNRNINNNQNNNVNNQAQENNDDPYGKKVFEKCLEELKYLNQVISENTNKITQYLDAQRGESRAERFIERRDNNISLYSNCIKVLEDVNLIQLKASKQKCHNESLISEKKSKINEISTQKYNIINRRNKINVAISNLEKVGAQELGVIKNNIDNQQQKFLEINNIKKYWYDVNIDIDDQEKRITDCNEIRNRLSTLLNQYGETKNKYMEQIKNKIANKQQLDNAVANCNEIIDNIKNINDGIVQIYNNYKTEYEDKYYQKFKSYHSILEQLQNVQCNLYERMLFSRSK